MAPGRVAGVLRRRGEVPPLSSRRRALCLGRQGAVAASSVAAGPAPGVRGRMADMNPFVFIVGAQRSGTTWLQRLLASHPAIAGGQESHLFSGYLAPLWQRWRQ